MTEDQARLIRDGVQTGDLDEIDLLCIAQDFDVWLINSTSYTAQQCRDRLQ